MIEVEKKFILTPADEARLIDGATFLHQKIFTDTYYDTEDFSLTSRGRWLRSRDEKFEFKIPLGEDSKQFMNVFDELTDENEIRKRLGLPQRGNLLEDLTAAGYLPFCTCRTTRRKYQKEAFILDLDKVDFEDFAYLIAEIELIVENTSEVKNASDRIVAFAQAHSLAIGPVRGKVIEYLRRKRTRHYEALLRAGIVKE